MKILLNGESHDLPGPMTIGALLVSLQVDPRRVAVEHNLKILKRATFDEVQLREGDQVEVVNFVGGGAAGGGTVTLPRAQRPVRDRLPTPDSGV